MDDVSEGENKSNLNDEEIKDEEDTEDAEKNSDEDEEEEEEEENTASKVRNFCIFTTVNIKIVYFLECC